MRYFRIVFLLCLLGGGLFWRGQSAGAQSTVLHPREGDPLRKTLFNVMRPAFEKELKQKVIFGVREIRVYQNWAFLQGQPYQPDQSPINYKKTRYQEAIREGFFGGEYAALLHKVNGQWKLVTYNIGHTDVVYANWWRSLPRAQTGYALQ